MLRVSGSGFWVEGFGFLSPSPSFPAGRDVVSSRGAGSGVFRILGTRVLLRGVISGPKLARQTAPWALGFRVQGLGFRV